MCGIFGYIGKKQNNSLLLDGLSRLEYRGYDSCGIACLSDEEIFIEKAQGRISNLRDKIERSEDLGGFSIGIAHTRWATHGRPSEVNSHPHCDSAAEICVVHNGIIENFEELRTELRDKGYCFKSETDTEVIPNLIRDNYDGDLKAAVLKSVKQLNGSFAVCVFKKDEPNRLIGIKKDSPLVVGVGEDSYYLASDSIALLPYTKQEICLEDEEIVCIDGDAVEIFDFEGNVRKAVAAEITIDSQDAEKGDYEHYMLKEMYEQPEIIKRLINLYFENKEIVLPELGLSLDEIRKCERVYFVACGTAYHAGFVSKYLFEKYSAIDVEIDVSSEFRYRDLRVKENSIVVAISQSGETADTIAAVKQFKDQGAKVISVCNVMGSSLTRISDGYIYTACGPEVGVASTKAYTSQVFCLMLLCMYMAKAKNEVSQEFVDELLEDIKKVPKAIDKILKDSKTVIENIASHYSKVGCFLFLGRGINYPTAMEGALKLKELSYIPAEGYAAGEMKHGPIALIDEYRAVVCIALKDALYDKMFSNIQEIKARKGKVFALISEGDEKIKTASDEYVEIPNIRAELSPLLAVIPLQLWAYYIAKNLGYDIDKPRNLAKSVTVE